MRKSLHRITLCITRCRLFIGLGCAALLCFGASETAAQQLDLSLNLQYNDTFDANSGGDWTLVGKAPDSQGIATLAVRISGIATQQAAGPTGKVNGGADIAGFSHYGDGSDLLDVEVFQFKLANQTGTLEERYFYGVGSVANGAPNFSGAPAGSTLVGPQFLTLNNYSYSDPWGADGSDFLSDPVWDIAVPLATGTFSAGVTPQFVGTPTQAKLFDSIPADIFIAGSTLNLDTSTINLFVRDDLSQGPVNPGDYNLNGIVDAADYAVWLDTLGQVVAQAFDRADGDGSGTVDDLDYELWKANFGNPNPTVGSGVGTGRSVPEPTTAVLAVFAMFLAVFSWREKTVKTSTFEYLKKNITTA